MKKFLPFLLALVVASVFAFAVGHYTAKQTEKLPPDSGGNSGFDLKTPTVDIDSDPDSPDDSPLTASRPVNVHDMIIVDTPPSESKISSPLTIVGHAKGGWFFEATFPVILTNWDGLIITEGYAQAEGDWMTEDFVPFTAKLEFEKPDYGERGFLIMQKSNPSGLPENDDALEVPVYFE